MKSVVYGTHMQESVNMDICEFMDAETTLMFQEHYNYRMDRHVNFLKDVIDNPEKGVYTGSLKVGDIQIWEGELSESFEIGHRLKLTGVQGEITDRYYDLNTSTMHYYTDRIAKRTSATDMDWEVAKSKAKKEAKRLLDEYLPNWDKLPEELPKKKQGFWSRIFG